MKTIKRLLKMIAVMCTMTVFVSCDEQEYPAGSSDMTGTGRFAGATGRGTIDCEVKGDCNLMTHHWKASLTLITE